MHNLLNYRWYLGKTQTVDQYPDPEFAKIDKAIEELGEISDSASDDGSDAIQSYKMTVKALREELTIIYSELDISRNSYEKLLLVELVDQLIKLVPKSYSSHIDKIYNYDQVFFNREIFTN